MNKSGLLNDPKSVAVKISKENAIDEINDVITNEELSANRNNISNRKSNIRFLKHLESFGDIPFLLRQLTDRNVVLYDDITEELEIRNLWAQELADAGDLYNYSRSTRFKSCYEVKSAFYNIAYKILYTMDKIEKRGIMHGDIKAANIFLKKCEMFEQKDEVCPIIADWDLGYYYDSNTRVKIPYTIGHKPLEMLFYKAEFINTDQKLMFEGNGGYKYSRKEDVFALGVTFIHVMAAMDRSFFTSKCYIDIRMKLTKMVYPVPIEEIHSLTRVANREQAYEKSANLIQSYYVPEIEKVHGTNLKNLNGHLTRIADYLKISDKAKIQLYLEEANTKIHNRLILFYRMRDMVDSLLKNKTFLTTILGNDENVNEFEELINYFDNANLVEHIIKDRCTMENSLESIRDLYFKDLTNRGSSITQEQLMEISVESHNVNNICKDDRNKVYLASSFLNTNLERQEKICNYLPNNIRNDIKYEVALTNVDHSVIINHGNLSDICKSVLLSAKYQSQSIFKRNNVKPSKTNDVLMQHAPTTVKVIDHKPTTYSKSKIYDAQKDRHIHKPSIPQILNDKTYQYPKLKKNKSQLSTHNVHQTILKHKPIVVTFSKPQTGIYTVNNPQVFSYKFGAIDNSTKKFNEGIQPTKPDIVHIIAKPPGYKGNSSGVTTNPQGPKDTYGNVKHVFYKLNPINGDIYYDNKRKEVTTEINKQEQNVNTQVTVKYNKETGNFEMMNDPQEALRNMDKKGVLGDKAAHSNIYKYVLI